MAYYPVFGSNYLTILFKYLFQTIKSFIILLKEKPDIIFVMNTPIFTCVPAWIYCKLKRAGYITDSHTAAFSMKIWQLLFPIQAFFFRHSITNIVTNKIHEDIVRSWGADCTVLGDIPVEYQTMAPYEKMKTG